MTEVVRVGADALLDDDGVVAARDGLPADADVAQLADVFGLLSDPNRVRLLACLRDGGELCVHDLAAVVGMGESTVSHALRLLRAHGVVAARRAGRHGYYRLADPHVRHLLDIGLDHVGHTSVLHTRPASGA